MDDQAGKTLSLRAAYAFGTAQGLEAEIKEIRDMVIEWDLSYTSSLRRGYIISLFEKRGIFEEFKIAHWPFGNSPGGEAKRRRFLRLKSKYEDFLAGRGSEAEEEDEPEVGGNVQDALEFALEAHLRDFLARNLERIEPGLRIYSGSDSTGIEYAIDGGRIDLLAVDGANKFVVIELKLSQGRNRTLGQLLYYMGWVDQHLGNGPCRGLIIAREINEELSVAVARVPGVKLARYRMSFAIDPVGTS